MRSTSGSSSARLVITALVCGSASSEANVAPPLKSTRTKLSSSDEWVMASDGHHGTQQLALAGAGRADDQPVRAHALLRGLLEVQLDHVAVGAHAERDPQPVPVGRGPPGLSDGSTAAASPTPSRSGSSMLRASGSSAAGLLLGEPVRGELPGQPLGRRRRSAGRGGPAATTRLPRSGRASPPSAGRPGRAASGRRRAAPSPDRSITVVPSSPTRPAAQVGETSPPSSTTTRCGAVVSGLASGANRGRPASCSGERRLRASARVAKTSRTGPAASVRPACWACGSHLTHSHSGCRSGAATTAITRSSGRVEGGQLAQGRPGQIERPAPGRRAARPG